MSEEAQLIYVKMILLAAETYNKIPKNDEILKEALRSRLDLKSFQKCLEEIKQNFPKFKENKYFRYFDEFETKTNYIPSQEIPRKSQGLSKDGVDKEEDKDKYLDFVFLTKKEYQTLCELFGEDQAKTLIEKLNNYIGSKGKKYKSHYFTILNWAGKDGIRKQTIAKIPDYIKDFKEPNKEEQEKVKELVKSTIEKMDSKKGTDK